MRLGHGGRAVIGAGLVALSWIGARQGVGRREERWFRVVNRAPDGLIGVAWPVMQAGSLAAVAVVAGCAGARRSWRSAIGVGTVGTAVWGGVKLVKPLHGRGRPVAHLDAVLVRGRPQSGLGFPSGHAAVSMTLALLTTNGLGRFQRWLAVCGALAVGVTRIYVGAHLPLDVVGGVGIGLVAGWSPGGSVEPASRNRWMPAGCRCAR